MAKPRKPMPSKPGVVPKAANAPAYNNVKSVHERVFEALPAFFYNTRLQSALIFLFAFALYANTLTHGFVLDDAIVITDNMFTEKGVNGIGGILSKDTFFGFFKVEGKAELVAGGRYRPFTLVLFALVYQMAGEKAFVFHLLTVLLYALTCVVLYRTLLSLFRLRGEHFAAFVSCISAVLFTVHPIHTEVVANIKGCDELVTLLLSLGALFFTLKAFDTQNARWSIAAGGVFFLACLSKENAVTFLAVIPLALWMFREHAPGARAGNLLRHTLPVFAAFVAFFAIRWSVVGLGFGGGQKDFMNDPFLKIVGNNWVPFGFGEKLATVSYTLAKYVQLLFVPHPLTHDYYPKQIDVRSFGNPVALLGLLSHLALAVYALSGLGRRDPLRFGILFYLITLSIVSNILFPVGTNMGERFVFMPSVGFCIVAAALLARLSDSGRKLRLPLGVLGAVALLFSVKTFTRNFDWVSNDNLFLTDVAVSGNSAKIQNACGGALYDMAGRETDEAKKMELYRRSVAHLNKAVEIYSNYTDAYTTRGGAHYFLKNYDASIADYRAALQIAPEKTEIKQFLGLALRDGAQYHGKEREDLKTALKYLTESWQINNTDGETAHRLGLVAGMEKRSADAVAWFQKATELNPKAAPYFRDLSTAWFIVGDQAKGNEMRAKALELNPEVYKNHQ
jgi:protein O-mannosyl-transferase